MFTARIVIGLMAKIESPSDDTDIYCNEDFRYNSKLSTQVHILWAARPFRFTDSHVRSVGNIQFAAVAKNYVAITTR